MGLNITQLEDEVVTYTGGDFYTVGDNKGLLKLNDLPKVTPKYTEINTIIEDKEQWLQAQYGFVVNYDLFSVNQVYNQLNTLLKDEVGYEEDLGIQDLLVLFATSLTVKKVAIRLPDEDGVGFLVEQTYSELIELLEVTQYLSQLEYFRFEGDGSPSYLNRPTYKYSVEYADKVFVGLDVQYSSLQDAGATLNDLLIQFNSNITKLNGELIRHAYGDGVLNIVYAISKASILADSRDNDYTSVYEVLTNMPYLSLTYNKSKETFAEEDTTVKAVLSVDDFNTDILKEVVISLKK